MAKKNKRNRGVRPDEVATFGPIRIARYGKFTVQESNFTKEEHQQFKDKLAEGYPVICDEIDKAITEFISLIQKFNPSELLTKAYWMIAAALIKIEEEAQLGSEEIRPAQFLSYLQNIIVSASPIAPYQKLEEEDFERIIDTHKTIFNKITIQYPMCDAAKQQKEGTFDEDLEEIRNLARMFYNVVWGKQYQPLEAEILAKFLEPHNEIFKELFGITVEAFIEDFKKIQHALTKGLIEAVAESHAFHKEAMEKLEEKIATGNTGNKEFEELVQEVITENGWQSRSERIGGQLFSDDLFNLQKITNLPVSLLEALSLSPGEDKTFLDENKPFKGWHFRHYPIRAKPFLKANDQYYCFNLFILSDNIYRALNKIITTLKPSYKDKWQEKQGTITEEYTFELFRKLLPNSEIIPNVFYPPVKKNDAWPETDGVICFDNNLFIIEVKGGAFSPYSPTTDFEGFQKSISELIGKPYTQGRRFLEYLESTETVQLYDKDHNPTRTLRLADFRNVTLCCVTLEQLTNLGGKLSELKAIGTEIDIKKRPVWSISIDDLRVYADLITNPLCFCHYLEKRNEALIKLDNLVIADELDHFGAYLEHNDYAMHFGQLPEFTSLQLNGYRSLIDRYYHSLLLGDVPIPPVQKLPSIIQQIIDVLHTQNKKGASKLASYLLDMGGDARNNFSNLIISGLQLQRDTGRAKIFGMAGINISAICQQEDVPLNRAINVRNDVLAAMLHANDALRIFLKLDFNTRAELSGIDFEFLTPSDINAQNEVEIRRIAESQKKKRVENHRLENGKIGRNDTCPCGSNKKYKKCCLM